jgi:hypothetical protein
VAFTLQRAQRGAGTSRGFRLSIAGLTVSILSRAVCALSALPGLLGGGTSFRRREFHAGTPRLGKADRNGLFGGARAVFTPADVMDLLADELACLGGGCLSFALILPRASDG